MSRFPVFMVLPGDRVGVIPRLLIYLIRSGTANIKISKFILFYQYLCERELTFMVKMPSTFAHLYGPASNRHI